MSFPVRAPAGFIAKPTPRVVEKPIKAAKLEKLRREIKTLVFTRDKGQCRVCGGHAHEMHELRFRSLGGKRSLVNSIAVCTGMGNGKNCHRLLQTLVIDYAAGARGANGAIRFTRGGKSWISLPPGVVVKGIR